MAFCVSTPPSPPLPFQPLSTRGLSLRAKILSGYLGLVLLPFLVLAFVYVKMAQTDRDLSVVRRGYFRLWQDIASVNAFPLGYEVEKENPDWLRYRPSLDRLYLDQKRRLLTDSRTRAKEVAAVVRDSRQQSSLERVSVGLTGALTQLSEYSLAQDRLVKALERKDFSGADAQVPLLQKLRADLAREVDQVGLELERLVETALTATGEAHRDTGRVVALLSAVSLLFGLLMMLLAHLTLKPVNRLAQGAEQVARGDFDLRLDIRSGDEIGALASRFEEMALSLKVRDEDLRRTIADLNRLSLYHERILRSMGQALVVFGPGGVVETVNPAAEKLLGPLARDLPPRLRRAVERGENEHLPLREEGVHLSEEEGTPPRILDAGIVPLAGEGGGFRGTILIADDVTVATRARERLMRAERMAAIGILSAQVTHEIRNPLNALGLNAELLGDELAALPGDASEARALLSAIRTEIDRLNGVAETYLTLARLPRPHLQPEDVGALLESLLAFHREEWKGRGTTVHLSIPPHLPEILADAGPLRQALLNLIRNAVDAMEPQGGGTLHLSITVEGKALTLMVKDEGPGMDPERLPRIFDPFFSTKASGTGLGLPITHQIVADHGGTIRCESEVGRGTTFWVELPLAPREGEETEASV